MYYSKIILLESFDTLKNVRATRKKGDAVSNFQVEICFGNSDPLSLGSLKFLMLFPRFLSFLYIYVYRTDCILANANCPQKETI